MSEEAMRGFVHAFCDALKSGDPSKVAPFLAEDVEWTVFGPVDLFPFFGQRRGKQAVLDTCAEITAYLELRGCDKESTLRDGDNAASLVKLSALHRRTGRTMSLRLAQFAHFRDGKLIRLQALFDSFDAAEQALGHHIDLSAVA